MNEKIKQLKVKIFSDLADLSAIFEIANHSFIKGLTTNPTLMHKEGIKNYQAFAKEILAYLPHIPVSFGIFANDFKEMEKQARIISSWGENVYVKIPITNTLGEYTYSVITKLAAEKIKLNVTAIMTLQQIREVMFSISPEVPCYISVFAGRIADTGVDPLPIMAAALEIISTYPLAELIWASPREIFNIFQADSIGCDVITLTKEILKKLPLVGYSLEEYSLDTVKMFRNDALEAGYEVIR